MTRALLFPLLFASLASAQPPEMDAKLTDGSRVKLVLLDDGLPVMTPHGRLVVPLADVRRIEFAARLGEETKKRIDAAIADLAHSEVARRDSAGDDLIKIGPTAFPAVLRASKSLNRDLAISARRLRDRFADEFAEQRLPAHEFDVVHTDDSKIDGRIELTEVRVRDPKFGDKTLRITDFVSLHAPGTAPVEPTGAALADPGTLTGHAAQTGKSFLFTVTGNTGGSVYGTDVYTSDSTLATACVHAGILKNGETRTVKVTILPGQMAYTATTRHDVTTYEWGEYSASYKISRT